MKDSPNPLSEEQETAIARAAFEVLPSHDIKDKVLPAIRYFQAEFKLPDPVETFKKKVSWWGDNPAKLRGNLTLQLRNWWRIEAEMNSRRDEPLQTGKNTKELTPKEKIYAQARKEKFDKLVDSRRAEIEAAQENGDEQILERINHEIKLGMAKFSEAWHSSQGKEGKK